MSLLHDYFHTRNLQLFQRLLENTTSDKAHAATPSTSGGRSWKKHGPLSGSNVDVNDRDWLGRTVLHLASASIEYLDYVRALLKHPAINVNLPDLESHWTPLHRALYNANIPVVQLLLQRPDTDATLKDNEGYTAFDVYNSTLIGTKPTPEEADGYADLYTWGTNVCVSWTGEEEYVEQQSLSAQFLPIRAKYVDMSKLHTAVITSESGGNLRVCGFGSGGRLGQTSHTQYTLNPLSQLTQTITSVALGQDHTLALTKNGEVFSWGLNRFSQLGYTVDPPTSGRSEEPIQYTPRKVQGFLRKEIVKGIAASKRASACWTDDAVYTWGTNNGQLGYDKAAQPVQVLPRKVSRLTTPVISIAMNENAMACLMQNRQVECFYNDSHHRINFPTHAFPSPIHPYRPPQAVKDSRMAKITSCGDVFASLSYHGEVYIFSPTNASVSSGSGGGPFKCQRVWALRRKSGAVKDVALGADGSIIICTESGHVFIRTRNVKTASGSTSNLSGASSQKAFKFQRVPFLQRVVRVCANSSGAFGALRVEVPVKSIDVKGDLIGQELGRVVPWLAVGREDEAEDVFRWKIAGEGLNNPNSNSRFHSHARATGAESDNEDAEGEMEDEAIEADIRALKELCDALKREEKLRKGGTKIGEMNLPHGADTLVVLQSGAAFPVHKVVLAARSEVLCKVLSSQPSQPNSSVKSEKGSIKISLLPALSRQSKSAFGPGAKYLTQLSITNANPIAVLIVLSYLYTDNVITIWDRRISIPVAPYAQNLKIKWDVAQIRNEVLGLAWALELRDLLRVLERPVKVMIPSRSGDVMIVKHMEKLKEIKIELPKALRPDVILKLKDGDVRTHSVILRSRSDLFKSFFDQSDWTRKRWVEDASGEDGDYLVRINLRHLKWRVMEFVLKFMCCGCDKELFETLEFVQNVDDLVEFMFEVMAAANELLLDRLVLLCSDIILTYSDIHNACYVLADATHYSATQLIDRIQSYITANMELFLESHMLDDIPPELVLQLAHYAQQKQKEKAPFVRGGQLADEAMARWLDWLAKQDLPTPFVRSNKPWQMKKTALPIPKFDDRCIEGEGAKVLKKPPSADDLFVMDAEVDVSTTQQQQQTTIGSGGPAWKAYVPPKVDMKSVMAEAEQDQIRSLEALKQPSRSQYGSSPQMSRGSPQTSGSPRKTTQVPAQQQQRQGGDETPRAQLSAPSLSQPSTPQKLEDGLKPPGSQGRTPSFGQLPNVNTTPTKQGQSSSGTPGPVMGPTITPMRMPAGSSKGTTGQRNVSGSSKAWAYTRPMDTLTTPISPASQNTSRATANGTTSPTPSSSTTVDANTSKSISFLAIQHSQQVEQFSLVGDPSKDKRSLVEIQKEEKARREEEKARKEEEDFLRWWEEEEARVRKEMETLETFKQGGNRGEGGEKRGGRGRGGLRERKEGKTPTNESASQDLFQSAIVASASSSEPVKSQPRPRPQHRKPSHKTPQPQLAE
ncbi:BTB/POZ domain-containing protein 1 [Leucoagaricus sp. SymC.cos]|nr:BTB/POZ domain-containing protein 1 [Leucoagaricus sp. SymC.cos]